MADQRSSHYNWFKGDSANGGKKSSKDSAKTVWKFTKIFLYFSLFFFSMWGCVQTFVLKTQTQVGQGAETYADKDSIAPQVASFHIKTNDATQPAEQTYDIKQVNDNIWLNERTNDEQTKQFKDVIDAIKKSTGKADFTLDEANKGFNGVVRFVLNDKEDGLRGLGTNPIVLSTSTLPIDQANAGNAITLKNKVFTIYKADGTVEGTITLDATKLFTTTDKNGVATYHGDWARNFKFNSDTVERLLEISHLDTYISTANTWIARITDTAKKAEAISRYNSYVSQVLNMLGVKVTDISKGDYSYTGAVLGLNSGKYTPIATWGQAWDMHRGAGPFYGIFVYPISWVTNKMLGSFPMMQGWESFFAIVLVVVVISIITFLLSFKGTLQQTRMQELNAKKAVIDAKYAPYKGNKQMEMRQRQEVSELYKKEGINPLSSLTTIFVTMPFFFAMWRVIGTIPHIKGTVWLHINFAATSWRELFAGGWQYLPLMAITVLVQLFSQIYPRLLTRRRDKNRMNVHQKAAMKKGNKMQNIMLIVFAAMAVLFTAGLQVYFLIRSLWRIFEVQLTHHIIVRQRKNRVRKATV